MKLNLVKSVLLVFLLSSCRDKASESAITNQELKKQLQQAQNQGSLSREQVISSYKEEIDLYIKTQTELAKKDFLANLEKDDEFKKLVLKKKQDLALVIQDNINQIKLKEKELALSGLTFKKELEKSAPLFSKKKVILKQVLEISLSSKFDWVDERLVLESYFKLIDEFLLSYPAEISFSPELYEILIKACSLDGWMKYLKVKAIDHKFDCTF